MSDMLKLCIAAVALSCLAASAKADVYSDAGVKPPSPCFTCSIELPPAGYLTKEPTVPVTVHPMPYVQANEKCHELYPTTPLSEAVGGCTVLAKDRCDIYVTNDLMQYQNADLIRHEKYGHCNGLVHGSNGRGWFLPDGGEAK